MQNNTKVQIDSAKLKEERKHRNKQKKLSKQLENQKKKELEGFLKLQPKSNYVTVLTQENAKKIVGTVPNSSCSNCGQFSVTESDFPTLEEIGKLNIQKSVSNDVTSKTNGKEKNLNKLNVNLVDLLNRPTQIAPYHKTKQHVSPVAHYNGNPLDSAMPKRSRGKFQEYPKQKKPTPLKREILKNKSEEPVKVNFSQIFGQNLIIQDEFEELIKTFIKNLVELQQKLYKRNQLKGVHKRRYVVGFHETKKHLQLNRIKILFLATNVQIIQENDSLSCVITELINKAKSNNVPYVFIFSRRQLGKLTLKFIPVSCVAVLNYESLEIGFNEIVKQLKEADEKNKTEIEDETRNKLMEKFRLALTCD